MPRISRTGSGWQGACLVAITYVYFLIFAQFAFLTRLSTLAIAGAHLKAVMAAMAAGGLLLSLLAPRVRRWPSPVLRLRASFAVCAVAAALALSHLGFSAALLDSVLIGAGLGLLTVTLVTHLRKWTGASNPLLVAGAGTGIGYLLCNIPPFFNASAPVQSLAASLLCVAGVVTTLLPAPHEAPWQGAESRISFVPVLAAFTALVWLDSAAFFIIQNTTALKAETWHGATHLWLNGVLHLGAALLSAWLLARRHFWLVLSLAIGALGTACLLLANPATALPASVLYPIGVSLYSVALVAYPSLLAPAASEAQRARIAGWIYAIAGWIGSALGIGMGQNLGHVPAAFVIAAAALVLIPSAAPLWRARRREIALTALILVVAWLFNRASARDSRTTPPSQIERGRQVYISEGCIHCHTQYVRPGTQDVLMWGPVRTIAEIRRDQPPLIGNRRQGPDLSQVGSRRSALWLKMHFYNPAQISGASIMPSYGFLFRDERGNDLVAYLVSLHSAGAAEHRALQQAWQPSPQALASASAAQGERLYQRDCATCHSAHGATRLEWLPDFAKPPVDLMTGPYLYLAAKGTAQQNEVELARMIRFGIPGTDMAGHEYLSGHDVSSIALWLQQHIAQSTRPPDNTIPTGDER